MSNILVLNSGSTSIKYKIFNDEEKCLKSGIIDGAADHEKALKDILRQIGDLRDLAAVGHRVVHGGDDFYDPLILDSEKIGRLEEYNGLAPLHNPYNLAGIRAAMNYLPEIPQAAVFDTGFFRDLPEEAKSYALPKDLSDRFNIRRYGFHGISHEYAAMVGAKKLGLDFKKANLITCHLGGGWSVAAIKKGKPIDTSMGFTPMEGLMMMTRPGDIDPGIIFYLLKQGDSAESGGKREAVIDFSRNKDSQTEIGTGTGEAAERLEKILNYSSGIKGVSGGIADYKELLKLVSLGNGAAKTAFDMAVYRLVKYIGSYYAALEGRLDGIVFTGRIGAGNPMTRNAVTRKLKFLKCPHVAVEADEELAIAKKVRVLMN
ncbi:MAG: acetate kinase [Patescibacteria group bacterium]|jgi:acetate kinase